MSDPVWAYLFEAKGIQRYLFHGGKLRDAVGASDLVAHIAAAGGNDYIGEAITKLGFSDSFRFSRRTGGAFCLHGGRDEILAVRRKFRRLLIGRLPGLEFSDAIGEGLDDQSSASAARVNLGGIRSNSAASVLPMGKPVFSIVPRTGLPMADWSRDGDGLDRILAPQRKRSSEQTLNAADLDGVAARFHPQGDVAIRYPRNLDDDDQDTASNPLMPWRDGSDRRVGLVHADVSGLGVLFAQAGCRDAESSLNLAEAIDVALLSAVQAANQEMILPHARSHDRWGFGVAPARPLVLGGDDMTLIVRADLALPFAARLLELIEKKTATLWSQFPELNLPTALSACAGVAISRAASPFLTLNALSESLCAYAKKAAKSHLVEGQPYASMLAFHVQQQTAEEEYERDIFPGCKQFTGNPYQVGGYANGGAKFSWKELVNLAQAISGFDGSANSLRRIKALLGNGRAAEAKDVWHRLFTRAYTLHQPAKRLLDAVGSVAKIEADVHTIPDCGVLFDALELIDLGVPLTAAEIEECVA